MSSFSSATKVFGVSLLAVPITYGFNLSIQTFKLDYGIPVCLGVVLVLTATCGLLVWITGFVSAYLKVGEPYLRCGYGALTAYWHGTAMYAMHLMMLAALTWDGNFYDVALFWCGCSVNSTTVLLLGVATVLGTNVSWITRYVTFVEPYLLQRDPAPFAKMQMLVYLFHHLPLQFASAFALLVPGCHWMPDLSVFMAGAMLQGQVAHIGASFHPRTPYVMRVPPEPASWVTFWTVNLLLALGPQFLAYRCQGDVDFFALRSVGDRKLS
ncbi:conserved hypothetical protein [Ixodes scapularis]|uniref:EXPERA domain-containing protein n=1 Tax=Ixodes scapularis TaxID=6945 RepID=B7P4T9_IXOSC|nr:conserved hypothetical protein [Ixodes scapularis]|eukprot:XP_002406440.1 conserved hypothetical protein [Ixodes scapularis]